MTSLINRSSPQSQIIKVVRTGINLYVWWKRKNI